METAVTSSNEFNTKLLQIWRNENKEGNIFYSPASIAIAISMLYTGARENTKKEIEDVLNIESNNPIHEGFSSILSLFQKLPNETVLNITNILAIDQKYNILPEYSNNLKSNYNAETKTFDFGSHPAKSEADLNSLVESASNGKIKQFFPDGSITPDTCLVLINAIYFKGLWSISFSEDNTTKKSFYTVKNEEVMVDMMFRRARYRMSDIPALNSRMLEMPYIGDKLSMLLILPNEKQGIAFLERSLSNEILNNAIQNLHSVNDVRLSLPRFKLEESLPLKQCLINLGMKDAFTNKADFSGVSGSMDTSVSAAFHKAYVEVNEEGTEASAVTGMVKIVKCSIPPPPVIFTVDHPFMFIIQDMITGLIIFTGSIYTL